MQSDVGMLGMKRNKVLIKVINLYLIMTIIYYFFGRYDWTIPSNLKLFIYLVLLLLALNIGYNFKYRFAISHRNNHLYNSVGFMKKERKVFLISCFSIIVFQIAWVITVLGSFDISNIFSSLGENYYERLSFTTEESVFIMQLRTILWGLTLFAYPIGFIYFNKLTKVEKIIFLTTITIDILASLNMGVSKPIGDIVIILILSLLVKKGENKKTNNLFSNIKLFRNIAVLVISFIIIFGVIQQIRDDSTDTQASTFENPYSKFADLRANTIFDIMFLKNDTILKVVDRMGAYISHGYTGLAFALELPFENTYGIGFSRALIEYTEQYTSISVNENTYMERIEVEYGWPNGVYWPTAYTWFASAFSFWLLPFIMFFLGYIIKRVELRYREYGDIYSLALLSQLFILAIYLPGNAQIFQSRAALFGTLLLIFLYIYTGRKYEK
ncbi:hypothetical protein [Planococcus beijingensis]|uniref:hypothetical protein n=1 Tax=Planococcus beijingensis TaxID=2782551 RepID=UPI00193B21D8|nr:hypothetical protein [Planococcus beijingensis]